MRNRGKGDSEGKRMSDIGISIDEVEKNFREAGIVIGEALLTSKEMIDIFRFRINKMWNNIEDILLYEVKIRIEEDKKLKE